MSWSQILSLKPEEVTEALHYFHDHNPEYEWLNERMNEVKQNGYNTIQ